MTSSDVAAVLPLDYLPNYASVPISIHGSLSPRQVILMDSSMYCHTDQKLQSSRQSEGAAVTLSSCAPIGARVSRDKYIIEWRGGHIDRRELGECEDLDSVMVGQVFMANPWAFVMVDYVLYPDVSHFFNTGE